MKVGKKRNQGGGDGDGSAQGGNLKGEVLGSSLDGSRVIQSGDGVGVLGKNYLIRNMKRLGKNSVVGKLVENRG